MIKYAHQRRCPVVFPALGARTGHATLRSVLFFLVVGMVSPLFSQQLIPKPVKPFGGGSVNLTDLARREKQQPTPTARKKVENEHLVNEPHNLPVPKGAKGTTFVVKPVERAETERRVFPGTGSSPATNFPAIGDNNTVIPPDMGGAVGPNHFLTVLNSQVNIQDKFGTTITNFPVSLNAFFLAMCTCFNGFNVFDPKVLYDPFDMRWIIVAPANSNSGASALLIAASDTSDPTQTWQSAAFWVDSTHTNWFDYPSIGFNKDWVVVTGNLYAVVPPGNADPFNGAQIWIINKQALYNGTSVPGVLNLPPTLGFTWSPAVTLDNSQNTEYLLADWNGNPNGNGTGNGVVSISTITHTGLATNPPTSLTINIATAFPSVNQTWMYAPSPTGSPDFAPQLGSIQKIQTNDSRMQGVVFRNGSLWAAQTAFLPTAVPTHTAVQWWQIDPVSANTQQFGRVEDLTAQNFYAFPSIAVNGYSDVLLGYSSFSATQFASSNYSFRLGSDPLNVMQPSVQFKAGSAPYYKTYAGSRNRWGDYSSTVVDPNDFTLCTLQEYAASPPNTWGTEWTCVPPVSDLYIKDDLADLGAEPSLSQVPNWESPYIWLRQQQDSTHAFIYQSQNAEYNTLPANHNYVYVQVDNRGGAPSNGTEQLSLYWAKNSSSTSWPSPWTGAYMSGILMGGSIATKTIPQIPGGGSYILEFKWDPPDPANYFPFGLDQNHFCLLARITTSNTTPFGMSYQETSNNWTNVQYNNNVAQKNLDLYDLLPGTVATTFVGNFSGRTMKAKLKFSAVDADGKPILLEKGTLKVVVTGKLQEIIQRDRLLAGGPGADANLRPGPGDIAHRLPVPTDTGNGTFEVAREGTVLPNIRLDPNDSGTLKIRFAPHNPAEPLTGYAIRITQLEEVDGKERIVGGQTLVFGAVKGFVTSPARGGTISENSPR